MGPKNFRTKSERARERGGKGNTSITRRRALTVPWDGRNHREVIQDERAMRDRHANDTSHTGGRGVCNKPTAEALA